jgi:hypothetical protein
VEVWGPAVCKLLCPAKHIAVLSRSRSRAHVDSATEKKGKDLTQALHIKPGRFGEPQSRSP